jgi:phage terminase small subunit
VKGKAATSARAKPRRGAAAPRADGGADMAPQQRLFALEYLVDLNATKAAERAGYSPRTAASQGSRLLKNVKVAEFIAAHMRKVEQKTELTVERLEVELARIVGFDPRRAYDENGQLLRVSEMPEDVARALTGFEEEALFDTVVVGEGPRGGQVKERLQVGVTRKVKWHGKVEAIALGLKRRGALIDRHEDVTPKEEISDEDWATLAALRHEVQGKRHA